jgi:Asp-tRNA(Asn)/Glu-tRNA(Gln) amidotransferase A subunit family amidase
MLDVMAGYDPDDPVTALGIGKVPATYTAFLDRYGLKGVRIGVLRTLFGSGPDHQEVNRVMPGALEVLKKHGAILVEVTDPAFDTGLLASDLDVQKWEYKYDLNNYLKAQPNPCTRSPSSSPRAIIISLRWRSSWLRRKPSKMASTSQTTKTGASRSTL